MVEGVAKFIKEQRIKKGMTQEQVASEMGLTRQTYSQIESGKRDIMLSEAKKLAGVFGMSLGGLVALRDEGHEVVFEETPDGETMPAPQIRVTREDLEKFKQVLLYVLCEVGGKPNIGETVLHKLLYFIDFDYYEKFEESLMGAAYIKNTHGPTSVVFAKIVEKMAEEGKIERVDADYFGRPQKRYIALESPDLGALSAREVKHIDDVLARLSGKSATEIADYSHGDIPWRVAEFGGEISYESVFYRDEKYSVREYEDDL